MDNSLKIDILSVYYSHLILDVGSGDLFKSLEPFEGSKEFNPTDAHSHEHNS